MKINPEVFKIKKTIIESRRDIHKHPELSFQEIADHAAHQMELGVFKEGYRKGVRIINVDSSSTNKFICPFIIVDSKEEYKPEKKELNLVGFPKDKLSSTKFYKGVPKSSNNNTG